MSTSLRVLLLVAGGALVLLGPAVSGHSVASAAEAPLTAKTKSSTITLKLSGLHCASCSLKIRHALKKLDGIEELTEGESKTHLVVKYQASRVSPQEMIKTIEKTGYRASLVK